jgi:uncharacterized protein YdcH (DUF465 family)
MSKQDSLQAHLDQLIRKHRELDEYIATQFRGVTVTDEVRRLKTQKLWLKDEIHRITRELESMEIRINGH